MNSIFCANESELQALAFDLAKQLKLKDVVYLSGQLGAGKTTMVRAILKALGYLGKVKSPTYTIVEPYQINSADSMCWVYHFDLYRVSSAQDVLQLGLEDYLTDDAICLIEWPERAANVLPVATLSCTIQIPANASGRTVIFRT